MSGEIAKTPDEIILGTSPGRDGRRIYPFPILGGCALVIPLLGIALGWMLGAEMQRQDGSGAAWAPVGLLWLIGSLTVACLIGVGLAIAALWRLERWPLLAAVGVLINGGFVLGIIRMLLS